MAAKYPIPKRPYLLVRDKVTMLKQVSSNSKSLKDRFITRTQKLGGRLNVVSFNRSYELCSRGIQSAAFLVQLAKCL